MARALKLYWSHSKPNFGDWLSPAICRALCHTEVRYASIRRCDLVGLGSLFERLPAGWFSRALHVWGTGSIDVQPVRDMKHSLHAVRGPRTAGLAKTPEKETSADTAPVFGDPGLLSELLLPTGRHIQPRQALGLIPHYKDAKQRPIAELAAHFPQAKLIDVFDAPEAVIEQIASCHHILSSSLHGLIVADALGVPSRWLQLSTAVRGGGWKFHDYYESFDAPRPTTMTLPLTVAELVTQNLDDIFADWVPPQLAAQKERLAAAFPQF